MGGGGVKQKVLFRAGCFPCFIQEWGMQGDTRINVLVSDVYQGNEEVG